jgi:hypothetical protein
MAERPLVAGGDAELATVPEAYAYALPDASRRSPARSATSVG